jgi:pimeloyl-ACP methyl ester carboxylesterase
MDFDFTDDGVGPTLLFLPGSYSVQSAWKGVTKALNGRYRVITTSLPGYGGSKEVRPDDVADMAEMERFVVKVIAHAGAPVHLIGHSYGGLNAFAATISRQAQPLSLITFEGNPIYTRNRDGEPNWRSDMLATNRRFENAVKAGDPDAAAIIIDYWGGLGVFVSLPSHVQEFCRAAAPVNVLDWRSASGFQPFFEDYAAIDVPVTIVRGALANQAMVDISARIAKYIPKGKLEVVDGAGHFLISTHPAECAAIIDRHMAALQ